MKTIVLNGARTGDSKVDQVAGLASATFEKFGQVDVFNLKDIKISDCLGCFGCWIKTPGQCVIDDDEREITRKLAIADLKVYVTPIVFGGYSYELKKALDRQLCNILPFFKKFNGEIHHPSRYEKTSKFIGIGVLPEADSESEAIFKSLITRNALNMHAQAHLAVNIYLTDSLEEVNRKIAKALVEVEIK
jgi:multimeric flavodoxin WrbA